MVSVTVLPGVASVVPDRVGVVSLPVAMVSIVIDGMPTLHLRLRVDYLEV